MTVVTVYPAATADDYVIDPNGSFFTNSSNDLGVGNPFGHRSTGMRFPNVTVPQGATINSAYLNLISRDNRGDNSVQCDITANDVDNATQVSSKADHDGRARTTAVVSWTSMGAWTANTEYTSPDIKTVIQEIVDRGSWSSGNAMLILMDRTGSPSSGCVWKSYDHADNEPPELEIDYTAAVTINPDQWLPRYPSQYDYKNAIASY